jgi:hypothetical protein
MVDMWLAVSARDGKKVREKVKKLATKVEEEDFDDMLEMVSNKF